MGLNKQKGNMYEFITHTWNTVKGECPHECSYCYMAAIRRRFNKGPQPPRFDEAELRTNLGAGNFIFVGSSNDLFAHGIPDEWIFRTLDHCAKFDNRYLFQSKNPARILDFIEHPVFQRAVVCTTIESNFVFVEIMRNCPRIAERSNGMRDIADRGIATYVTIEPIMRFDLDFLVHHIQKCRPTQVNIGADSGHNRLPEPSKEDVLALIAELEKFTTVKGAPAISILPLDYQITDSSEVSVIAVKSAEVNYFKKFYMSSRVNYSEGGDLGLIFCLDGKAFGFASFERRMSTLSDVFMSSDFVVNSNVPKLSKLLIMLLKSRDVRTLLAKRLKNYYTGLKTSVYTDKPVSSKYRGVFKLERRDKGKLMYRSDFEERSIEEIFRVFCRKYLSESK